MAFQTGEKSMKMPRRWIPFVPFQGPICQKVSFLPVGNVEIPAVMNVAMGPAGRAQYRYTIHSPLRFTYPRGCMSSVSPSRDAATAKFRPVDLLESSPPPFYLFRPYPLLSVSLLILNCMHPLTGLYPSVAPSLVQSNKTIQTTVAQMSPPHPRLAPNSLFPAPSATSQEKQMSGDTPTASQNSGSIIEACGGFPQTPLPAYPQGGFILPPWSSSVTSSFNISSPLIDPSQCEARAVPKYDRAVQGSIPHPYARLYNKKKNGVKSRKMWNHALEKLMFTPHEMYVCISVWCVPSLTFSYRQTMGAPHRRTIYLASLEAHIDRLHEQLLTFSLAPVPIEALESYRGLNAKIAKVQSSSSPRSSANLNEEYGGWVASRRDGNQAQASGA